MSDRAQIRWRRLDITGTDEARLARDDHGWSLAGVATLTESGRSCRLEYFVSCDAEWRTRRCTVSGVAGEERVGLALTRSAAGQWSRDGARLPFLDGCEDVDLGFTPATNTLPIRRLGLAVGDRAHVRAAWVRFPGFGLEVLEQDYTRIEHHRYRYESAGGGFRRELTVDETGMVVDYPGLWIAERPD